MGKTQGVLRTVRKLPIYVARIFFRARLGPAWLAASTQRAPRARARRASALNVTAFCPIAPRAFAPHSAAPRALSLLFFPFSSARGSFWVLPPEAACQKPPPGDPSAGTPVTWLNGLLFFFGTLAARLLVATNTKYPNSHSSQRSKFLLISIHTLSKGPGAQLPASCSIALKYARTFAFFYLVCSRGLARCTVGARTPRARGTAARIPPRADRCFPSHHAPCAHRARASRERAAHALRCTARSLRLPWCAPLSQTRPAKVKRLLRLSFCSARPAHASHNFRAQTKNLQFAHRAPILQSRCRSHV